MRVNNTPYQLPTSSEERIRSLANIIGIEGNGLANGGFRIEEILCGVILYRHLDRSEKLEIMSSIYELEDKRIASKLVEKVTDVIVNPSWGLWSMTNAELLNKKEFHSFVQFWSAILGFGVSVSSGKGFLSRLWKERKILSARNSLIMVVCGGLLYSNKVLSDTNLELERRKMFIETKFH